MISVRFQYVFIFCQLSKKGGRLIIASDGVWDALSCEVAAQCCRGLPPDLAAMQVVKVVTYIYLYFCLYGWQTGSWEGTCKKKKTNLSFLKTSKIRKSKTFEQF